MLESATADGAYLARHDAALKSLVSAQGRRGLVRFPAPVALVLGVARALLSDAPRHLVRRSARAARALTPLAVVLRHQHLRQ